MDPDGSGLIGGAIAAITGIMGWADPPPPADPLPGVAVIELRTDGDTLTLAPGQVVAVQPEINPQTGAPQVGLTLDERAAARFGEITAAHVGDRMDLSVCGDVIMSPVIQAPIPGGRIVIAGNFTMEDTEELARTIAGDIPCATDPRKQRPNKDIS